MCIIDRADIAHPINIGTHGNTETGAEVLEDMLFKNIDILDNDDDDRDYQGCMAINVGDHNLAQNITFEDISVEHIQEGQLFHLRVMYNRKYKMCIRDSPHSAGSPMRIFRPELFHRLRYPALV